MIERARNWTDRLWNEVPARWPHAAALAVQLQAPARSEDLAPGARPHGWSPGAHIHLVSPRILEITIAPAKSHGGKYGSPAVTTRWDPVAEGGPAVYLAGLCNAAGGRIVVSISSKDAHRSALARLGHRALPEFKRITITPNVVRNQVIADIKCTVGAGEETASAAGHVPIARSLTTGGSSMDASEGDSSGEKSTRRPRASNVARARALAKCDGTRRRPTPRRKKGPSGRRFKREALAGQRFFGRNSTHALGASTLDGAQR